MSLEAKSALSARAAVAAALCVLLWALTCTAADRAKVLNVYAWPEYFPPALIAKFQAETGIHVNYSVLDSPAAAETILSVGHSNYDIVTMNAAPELAREIPKGFWRKLDRAALGAPPGSFTSATRSRRSCRTHRSTAST